MQISRYRLSHSDLRLKIAILADIHDYPIHKARRAVMAENPDLILIPGDIITGHISKAAWYSDDRAWTDEFGITHKKSAWKPPKNAAEIFEQLSSVAPTYFSLGNHEHLWQDADVSFVESLGVHVLDNRYERIGDSLVIGGLSSAQACGLERIADPKPNTEWLSKFDAEKGYKILLMHEPQLWSEYIEGKRIDLTVSGHVHGGQWRVFGQGIFAPGQGFFPELSKGFYYENRLLISAGLANTAPVPRFFNPTELVILSIGE